MKHRLVICLLLLVCLPLALFFWMGTNMAHGEQARVKGRFTEVLQQRLEDVDKKIADEVAVHQGELEKLLDFRAETPTDVIRGYTSHPLVLSVFAINKEGKRVHPPRDDRYRTDEEREFLLRTHTIWSQGKTLGLVDDEVSPFGKDGWHVWFWGKGANYLYWKRVGDGQIIGFEISRSALLQRVIGALPADAGPRSAIHDGRIKLTDAQSAIIYQWGTYEPKEGGKAMVTHPVSPPFESWRLDYYAPDVMGAGLASSTIFNLTGALIAAAVALLVLGWYFFREHRREMRTAEQRVSFVSQVSHELKTPLTNICMFAELAEQKLPEGAEASSECLDVVVSESERLSRLIRNVLSFSKNQRDGLKLNLSSNVLDDVIRDTVAHFRPSLSQKDVEVNLDLDAGASCQIDRDAIEQILGNLISNVEKYAGKGGLLEISSQRNGRITTIDVRDEGPGIPDSSRRRIFDAFYRVSNKVSDGVSGTGIGLGIARELARLHGGDLVLLDSEKGAHFQVQLKV